MHMQPCRWRTTPPILSASMYSSRLSLGWAAAFSACFTSCSACAARAAALGMPLGRAARARVLQLPAGAQQALRRGCLPPHCSRQTRRTFSARHSSRFTRAGRGSRQHAACCRCRPSCCCVRNAMVVLLEPDPGAQQLLRPRSACKLGPIAECRAAAARLLVELSLAQGVW